MHALQAGAALAIVEHRQRLRAVTVRRGVRIQWGATTGRVSLA